MARLTMNEAIVAGVRAEFIENPKVFCMGQDIGPMGGPLQSFHGLWNEFKNTGRIIDAPISEEAMVAACMAAAMCGMRPVLEIMFSEFINLTLGPLANEAGQVYFKTDGLLKVPMVIRTKFGVSAHRGHAEDYHSMLTGVPGLKVIMPSNAKDAKGLMRSAIRDDNPVIFFEHMGLQHGKRAEVPDDDYLVPIGVADIKRAGKDVTVVATALMLHRALKAADHLISTDNVDVEVIDPRTIYPLDKAAILASVKKTGRLVIVHENWKTGGSGGEIAAMVAEEGFQYLKGPIIRIAPPSVPVPHSLPLEKLFIPDEFAIANGIRKALNNISGETLSH